MSRRLLFVISTEGIAHFPVGKPADASIECRTRCGKTLHSHMHSGHRLYMQPVWKGDPTPSRICQRCEAAPDPNRKQPEQRCLNCDRPLVRAPGARGRNRLYCTRAACQRASVQCSVRGCKNLRQAHGVCRYHSERPVTDYCNIYCQLCGFGPRVRLDAHVIREHGSTQAYREQFGRYSLVSEGYRALRSTLYEDMRKAGVISPKQRQKTCANGHRLTEANTMGTVTINGKVYQRRTCRKCWNEWHNKHRREKRAAAAVPMEPRICANPECAVEFTPERRSGRPQRFHSNECKVAYFNARRKS